MYKYEKYKCIKNAHHTCTVALIHPSTPNPACTMQKYVNTQRHKYKHANTDILCMMPAPLLHPSLLSSLNIELLRLLLHRCIGALNNLHVICIQYEMITMFPLIQPEHRTIASLCTEQCAFYCIGASVH